VQLIDASSFFVKLRKCLGNKRNEISAENRKAVTKLYADFVENEFCKIFPNTEFMYREYKVMQPLQRSYAITEDRIEKMLADGALSGIYDESRIYAWENSEEELTAKEQAKFKAMQDNKPLFDLIVQTLRAKVSEEVWKNPGAFTPILKEVFNNLSLNGKAVTLDKKLVEKIMDGLSVMDKTADIQKDKKGTTLYDPQTADTEIVKYGESIDDYMEREVLPHVPDAKAFFEENLNAKKPVIKTGAEIPFTRCFYKYQNPEKSEVLARQFLELEESVNERITTLFKRN
jgi:type I restriction enzyme M protein